MFTLDKIFKLGDYGAMMYLGARESAPLCGGTTYSMSPDSIKHKKAGKPSDMWSLG